MKSVIFATGNNEKFLIGQKACALHGIELSQRLADTEEIQSEDLEKIIRDKAERVFEVIGLPLVVSDDAWSVPGLNGFPGPYMKSMDHWLTPQNWLDLTKPLQDKRIILIQQLAYYDGELFKLIRTEYTGTLLTEAKGSYGKTLQKVVTMPGDGGLSIAEVYDKGAAHLDREVVAGWRAFAEWYTASV